MIGGAKGIGIGIDFGIPNQYCRATSKPYIEKDVLDSLRVVASAYGKSNDDADRSIVKNLVDASNPFIISNAAFKLNSGFGKYSADFESFDWAVNISQKQHNKATISLNGRLCNHAAIEVDEMKVNIIGNVTELIYWYIANPDDTTRSEIRLTSGINTLPKSYAKDDGQTYNIGFAYISGDSEITIEQIPSFEGAFVTDGVNDLITSTKTVQEMGITDEVTVVSMIHQIDLNSTYTIATTNYIENSNSREHVRSDVYNYGKTGIYGYSASLINNTKSDIKNILGDEADYYVKSTNSLQTIFDAKFSVVGRISELTEASQVAWYWTIIANKVLTSDQINQVIAYFNLDRTLNPDILCNTIKQGITNENHAEFGDKLIDFSGNGRDIQLKNIAWKGDSGIGRYETELSNTSIWTQSKETTSSPFSSSYNGLSGWIVFANTELTNSADMPSFKIQVKGLLEGQELIYRYYDSTGQSNVYSMDKDGEYTLPSDVRTAKTQISNTSGFQVVKNEANIITITQIPSHAGGLCLDGVNDFGQYVGDLGLKDYTIAVDRAYVEAKGSQVPIISNVVDGSVNTPFLMEHLGLNKILAPHSFGKYTRLAELNINRFISYQSTYKYNGSDIIKGTSTNAGSGLTIGRIGGVASQYANIALWSLLLFPYTLSEFLLERQLKKHKLGTLYPNMVEFRPVIKSNASYDNIAFYYKNEKVENGTYLTVGSSIGMHIRLSSSPVNEIKSITVNGIPATFKYHDANNNIYQYDFNLTSKSPQNINITIDEYIRYEDIVQPYPVLLRFNDENGNEVSWGGKFRVGSTITRIGSIADPESNLLNGLYSISGLSLNGKSVTSSTSIVEKRMVFKTIATYLLDNNEPKCILSPSRLRIPNSSYKILGYIPDISGHGNHGVIHNSAYALNSGANGYTEDFTKWTLYTGVKCTDSIISLDSSFNKQDQWILFKPKGSNINQFTINIKGIPDGGNLYLRLSTDSSIKLENGINEISSYTNVTNSTGFFIGANGLNLDWSNLVIEQVGEYEGAYCLDGVDDFVTIPTTVGGKQVLMKVNSRKSDCYLYDQRNNRTQYLGIVSTKDFIAYNYSNQRGKTYIDGILNENITANDLISITHNITVTNNRDDVEQYFPCIGTSFAKNSFAQMSLYDFMLFDNISTDDKIKELNEYVGIEAKVELPPYYWDAYGKTNLDADKATIQQRGVAVGDYDLTNHNHAYEGMSGYNGYPVVFGANKTWENLSSVYSYTSDVTSTTIHITRVKNAGTGLLFSYVKKDGALTNIREIPAFRVTVKGLEGNSKFGYRYLATEDATVETLVYLGNGTHELSKSFTPTEALLDLTRNAWVGIFITPMVEGEVVFDCDITIEVLPEYENGLVYDGVDDYSKNENIPVLTDYTIIAKRLWINKDNPLNEQFIHKGAINTPISESAFMLEYEIANDTYYRSSSYGGYINIERSNRPERIVYQTSNSYNGTSITKGSGTDTTGIVIGGVTNNYWNGVFYKLMLYSKTLPLLQINYLKNLMEKDEIIDLNNKIFIQ